VCGKFRQNRRDTAEATTTARSITNRLVAYEHRYRPLAERITDIGCIAAGSITHRYGTPQLAMSCRPTSAARPLLAVDRQDRRHDRHLPADETEARFCQQWVGNDRQPRALIARMRDASAKTTELITNQARRTAAKVLIAS
jgi:hypothetical protein